MRNSAPVHQGLGLQCSEMHRDKEHLADSGQLEQAESTQRLRTVAGLVQLSVVKVGLPEQGMVLWTTQK